MHGPLFLSYYVAVMCKKFDTWYILCKNIKLNHICVFSVSLPGTYSKIDADIRIIDAILHGTVGIASTAI